MAMTMESSTPIRGTGFARSWRTSMKACIHGKYGRASAYDMYTFLGVRRLPPEGMPERLIDGVRVYVKPLDPERRRFRAHRVFAICECGQHVPTGRLHQHKCKP